MKFWTHGVISVALLLSIFLIADGKQPHIVFIVADDLGWNDVSWRNSKIFTPNLEVLAKEGVILNQSYVQPVCTPSRVSFMTGYYPYKVGRQNHVLQPLIPTGVPLRFKFLPEKLREVGYSTHLIGKWHLGYCNLSYTPTMRGFDTFFGFYNGALDYFSHTTSVKNKGPHSKWNGMSHYAWFDLRNNTRLSKKYNGKYSTHLLAKEAERLIARHSPNDPMFLFLSFQAVHSPLQVPKVYEDKYKNIKNEKRRKYSGMITAMDDAIGKVVDTLKLNGYWENTVLIFTTDNGGQTLAGGNNWPLRGNKGTMWEGGTRAVAFVHGTLLKKSGYVNEKLFHAVDWFPTILNLAGAKPVSGIDGVNQWKTISEDREEIRKEFIYNIYDLDPPRAAIRVGDFKLIQGFPGRPEGWIAPAGTSQFESTHCVVKNSSESSDPNIFKLYNVRDDPTERNDIIGLRQDVAEKMILKLTEFRKDMVPADDPQIEEKGNPKLWKGSFTPGWCTAN